ncbi:MAG: hypothetical protein OHK006_13510 [Thermodesulfovibrionales bacterium]
MGKNAFFCAGIVLLMFGVAARNAGAGDVVITKWNPSSKQCHGNRGANVTVRYLGEGSKLVSNGCFRAVFPDNSYCEGSDGDFDDIRVTDNGKETTRAVCFCRSSYRIREIVYRCQDSR